MSFDIFHVHLFFLTWPSLTLAYVTLSICRNGDGYIDREEFAEIIRSTGESISEEEIDELLKDGDKNNDGMLDFDGMMQLFYL